MVVNKPSQNNLIKFITQSTIYVMNLLESQMFSEHVHFDGRRTSAGSFLHFKQLSH